MKTDTGVIGQIERQGMLWHPEHVVNGKGAISFVMEVLGLFPNCGDVLGPGDEIYVGDEKTESDGSSFVPRPSGTHHQDQPLFLKSSAFGFKGH